MSKSPWSEGASAARRASEADERFLVEVARQFDFQYRRRDDRTFAICRFFIRAVAVELLEIPREDAEKEVSNLMKAAEGDCVELMDILRKRRLGR
jgi:hypothetical protein